MNSYKIYTIQFFIIFFNAVHTAVAQPSLFSMQEIAGQKIYQDIKQSNIFYYLPGDYTLATDASGKPDLSLLQMRYTGTRTSGDQGVIKFLNILQFHVTAKSVSPGLISKIKSVLVRSVPAAELKIVPIKRFSSLLVFARISAQLPEDSISLIKTSYSDALDENADVNNTYWNDRIITIRLSDYEAQLVDSALRKQQAIMSFSYAMYSEFSDANSAAINITGNESLVAKVKDYFQEELMNLNKNKLQIMTIKASSFGITANANRYPTIIRKIDINETVPARYAVFDVYCYDFNNDLRPDLFGKKIEIKATGVNGSPIISTITFKRNQPDIYARCVRFKYAVRFDRPFSYRITEITNEGETNLSEWKEKKDWIGFVDITSMPDKIITTPNINQ